MERHILLIATGGTIASVQTKEGLSPGIAAEELLSYLPEIPHVNVSAMDLLRLDSTNIEVSHWLRMAEAIRENYARYDGFVLCHGTDTMAYTASALSYLVQNAGKPIVLTGAQKPINAEDTDARVNLSDAVRFAADPRAHDVCVVFQGSVIAGTHVQKERTKSYNAFASLNFPPLATILGDKIFFYIDDKQAEDHVAFFSHMDASVGLLKLVPSLDPVLLAMMGTHCRALIIESFGVGGLPTYHSGAYRDVVQRLREAGKLVVMATQVPYEGSDMAVYAVGKSIKEDFHLLEAHDMTLPAVVTKLMWILGATDDLQEAKRLFARPVNHDTLWGEGETIAE